MELKDCIDFLRNHDNFTILTHRRPDGDTLGSAAALCHGLRRAGKTAWLFPNRETTELFRGYVEEYFAPEGYAFETVVSVDVAERSLFCAGFDGEVDLWIDHHPTRSGAREPGYIREHNSSCGEVVLDVIEALCGNVSPEEADLLYIAVSTDTGCFVYDNTNADTHRAAARLLDYGANLPLLNKPLFRFKSAARLQLEGMICSGMRVYEGGKISVAVVTLDMLEKSGATEDDCNDLASLAGQVRGNMVAVTVRELSREPARCKVSLRTEGTVSAMEVCMRFGGGGHRMASGCELTCSPEETAERVLQAVYDLWP